MSAMTAPSTLPTPAVIEDVAVTAPRSWKSPIIYAVASLIALFGFAVFSTGNESSFKVAAPNDFFTIPDFTLNAQVVGWIAALTCIALTAYSVFRAVERKKSPLWLPLVFSLVFVFAFLTWAVAGVSSALPLTGLLQGALALSVPLVFGSLGGVIGERSGVVNVAIEGQLLGGAFLSAVVASLTGSPWIGLIAAMVGGMLVSLILVLFSIKYIVNQIIVGVVINVLIAGLTNYLYSTVLTQNPSTWNTVTPLPRWEIPLLSKIPLVGPVLFNQTAIVYIMYIVVIAVQVLLFRSKWGLRTRAIGEHPKAADTVGIKVNAMRIRNVLIAGAIAGLGGAFFTLGSGLAFGKEMSGGKGFIALAAMIFGRWSPVGALGAALLFGFADNLQNVLGIMGTPIPSEFMLMVPYLATIFAVAGLVGRSRGPAAAGEPYIKA